MLVPDPRIHPAKRLQVMLALTGLGGATTWTELRATLDWTDGALARHVQNLAVDGMLSRSVRSPRTERSRRITRIWLTPPGRQALSDYIATMTKLLDLDI